jgi:hypothetical protein
MRRPEQEIQKAVFAHLKQRGAPGVFFWHPFSGGYRRPIEAKIYKSLGAIAGLPDVMVLKDGVLYGLELKALRGSLTVKQDETLRKMAEAGAIVDAVRGLNAALIWLEMHGLLRRAAA